MIDVELRNVAKKFGDVMAVDGVSLQVRQGEFLTLLGPSGCGKTTTLRMIAGLERPTTGEILIRGEDVTDRPAYARDASLMFQNYALFPHKSVFDNVAFGLKYRERDMPKEERKRRAREALELVHLPGIEARYPRQLSGGQQQRVALARALVVKPAVLLLDEPLSNLDLKLREKMRVELKQIQEQVGITFIFVTHDQEEALMLSDQMAVMEGGRLVQLGTPREVYERPRSRFVGEFIGQSNFLEGRVVHIGRLGAKIETDSGLAVRLPSDVQVSIGNQGILQIRAERVNVHRQKPTASDGCAFSGTVERAVYVGTTVQYFIRLESQDLIMAIRPAFGELLFGREEAAWISFDPEDLVWLKGA
ncbi:MAG: ABC transporter ATP-binding protein [Ardenticatenaceae bacterium]|nr:ABC transporter ATP-binding protein [Ardenticatenaceae bacterium]